MDLRGKKISAKEFRAIKIEGDEFQGDQAGEAVSRAEIDRTAGAAPQIAPSPSAMLQARGWPGALEGAGKPPLDHNGRGTTGAGVLLP